MIDKQITNTFDFKEPSIQRISFEKRGNWDDFIKGIKKEEGYTTLLVLALGAGEYYGCNRNGDYFSESWLKKKYKTFETHGHNYKHHVNKDPNKSYGKITKAYWNPKMKRVELLIKVDNNKANDIIERVNNNDLVPVSMACRVPYDVCSICGHKSKSTKEYCKHLKEQMTKILSDGRQVYAFNVDPIFFDISYVFRPADRTAYVLTKVARDKSYSIKYAKHNHLDLKKEALLRKLSEIEKEIEGYGFLDKALPSDSLSEDIIAKLKEYPSGLALSSLAKNGIILSMPDFLRTLLPNNKIPDIEGIRPPTINHCLEYPFEEMRDSVIPFGLANIISKIKDSFSLLPDIATNRALEATFKSPTKIRIWPGGHSVSRASGKIIIKSSSDLGGFYNGYKIASALLNPNFLNDKFFLFLVVKQR